MKLHIWVQPPCLTSVTSASAATGYPGGPGCLVSGLREVLKSAWMAIVINGTYETLKSTFKLL